MQTELKNKIAIVTGSYGDIGRAICQKLASNGIKIALLGRDLKKLKSQKSKLLEKNKTEIIGYLPQSTKSGGRDPYIKDINPMPEFSFFFEGGTKQKETLSRLYCAPRPRKHSRKRT